MAELDNNAIWITYFCPACKLVAVQTIADVGFGMDIDLEVNDQGAVDAWLEADCPHCGAQHERRLNKE